MTANMLKLASAGMMKYGSDVVRSVNHPKPPWVILSTGRLAILRRPMKNEMKIGACTKNV